MLKVVGASWSQTRYSSLLIASVALMGMVTILFLEFVPRDVYDGRYAATVFWNAQTGFRIEFWGQGNDPRTIRKGVARAYYRPEMLSTGWAVLEIETQPSYPDHVQAHAAGLLEGSLSWQLIYWHWQNTVDSACEGRVKFCDEITQFLEDNRDFIREKARLYDHQDPFWHQVNMFYEQLDGLEVGWRYAVKRSRQEDDVDIPRTDFLWLNVMSDILDLEAKKNMSKELIANNRPPLSLALLKLIPGDMTDFILSHATGGYYSSMLRVQKQYKFGLHETGKLSSRPVPGQIITFTSYPGSVFSQDDFYKVTNGGSSQANSKLVISGTVLKNLNPDSWALVDATEQVLIGPRVLAANRLARNPEQWAEIISKNSSGTGNKQWLVIQPKVSQGQGQESGNATAGGLTVWIAEQMPGLSRAGDISAHLKDSGYFISYGLPMFKDIQNVGGYHKHERKELTAARLLLQQGQENVTDLKTMLELMRSPDISLFGRGDLLTMDELTRQTDAFYNDSLHFFPAPNKTHPNHLNANNNHNLKKTGQLDLGLYASNPKKSFRNVFKKIIALKKLRKELSTKDENESSASSDSAETVQSEEDKLQFRDRTQILPHSPKSINDAQKPDLTGVIDFKVLTHKDDVFHAASGPLYSKYGSQIIIEPFQWSKSQISDHPHNGHSDIWQFEPVQTEWVW